MCVCMYYQDLTCLVLYAGAYEWFMCSCYTSCTCNCNAQFIRVSARKLHVHLQTVMVHVQYIKLPLSSSNFSRDTQILMPNMKKTALQVSAAFGHAHFASYTQCTILRTLAISACHRLFIYTLFLPIINRWKCEHHHHCLSSMDTSVQACASSRCTHMWLPCVHIHRNKHSYIDTIQKQDLELVRPHMGFVWLSRTLQTSPVCISAKHMPH